LEETFKLIDIKNQRSDWLKKELQKTIWQKISEKELQSFVVKLYEKAYSAMDIIKLIEDGLFRLSEEKRYELLIAFNKVRKEFRNEKLLIMFMINFIFLDKETVLENISFM
jgi:DNA polymerase III alpha subunit